MERPLKRDEPAARFALGEPVAARELQRRLDRFRSAVAEKRAWQAGERRQTCGKFSLERVKEQIRGVDEPLRLIGDRLREPRMGMTQGRDADPGDQVQVAAPV